ncbi:SpoIIE family protein phosphatase [Nonomuraea gerenzanensis]|uniref:protein-serine/threonine phosphatase n=1 Tax=Nonomuraea gerenzanensis TaxID=93944 RepID=A0A1M4EIH4_9ACTN|nr:SpoIIE family protein phosphatase [Nonomuraea gerenzanensis]UBU10205.1 SpoIIE family protein phosphatase [Nonomuraea gerenzanensis]SBO98582.1 Serine phosphatase RsbU, regulator of sigma subunit [Nonomuraea gerenzanensis]
MGGFGSSRLDELLIDTVTATGAHIGATYLLDDSGQVLQMAAEVGLPAPIARAWARVRTKDPVPIAVAVRERRLIWISGRQHLAREFPAAALALPYPFAAALSPICADGEVRGGFMLLWPAGRTPELTPRRRDLLDRTCATIGELLRAADRRGRPIRADNQPRLLGPRPVRETDPRADLVALECLNRLPEGYCMLDVEGRATLVSAPAADLLGVAPAELLGKRLWEVLPWLASPEYEDRYRAAVIGRQITQFVGRNPAGRRLSFWLYPGLSGITLRITPGAVSRGLAPDPVTGGDRTLRVIAVHEILNLATALARAVTAQEVLDLVADHVMPVYDVQALAILTEAGGRLRVAASRGYSRQAVDEFDGRPVIPAAPADRLSDAAEPAFFSTWDQLRAAYPDAIRSDGMSAWAFLPLVTSGQPIGTCILAYDRPHRFGTDERATLTALTGLIAQAFERARLYDVKHQLAQCLQSSLLPHTLPRIPGLEVAARYVPATPGMDIGGDFYDLIRVGDTLAAAVIGDVQGHDVTAAALMGQVRTAVRAHAAAGGSAGDVLAHTNRLLVELAPDRFTSCLYVSFDLRRHTACVASAGHPPPVLGRPGAPARIVATSPGLLLGIDPDAEYATTDLPMEPGSVLALYTDGLIEEPGRDLGDAIAALAARFDPAPGQSLDDLAEALVEPAAIERRTDDIAVLLLRDTSGGP